MITPKQAAETLHVSTSTLRRWSGDFSAFLSPRTGTKRSYTIDDIATLKRARDLFSKGITTAQINQALPIVDNSGSAADNALVTIPDFAAALTEAREEQARLSEKVKSLSAQVDALTNYLSTPLYTRIFTRPGKSSNNNNEKENHETD